MYNIIKNVIDAKRYELADMLKKIDTLWVQGSITDDERTELISKAHGNAIAENSVDIMSKLSELDKRITAIENIISDGETEGDDKPSGEYKEYEVGKWYYNGDTVLFDGDAYICIAPEGVTCVWSPAEMPSYWTIVE